MATRAENRLAPGAIVVGAVFLYCALWVFQGIDMTDEGYHLANQSTFFGAPRSYDFGMLWLTHLLGGVWLLATNSLGLLGARLGWVAVQSCTAWVAYRILVAYFRPLPAAAAVVAAAVAVSYHGLMVINQNNIPFLILLIAVGFVLAMDRAESCRRRLSPAFLAGVFLGLAAMARLPLLTALPLVGVPLAGQILRTGRTSREAWAALLVAVAGWAGVLALALVGMRAGGQWGEFRAALGGYGVHEGHTLDALRGIYCKEAVRMARIVLGTAIRVVPWAVGCHVLLTWLGCRRLTPVLTAAALYTWFALGVATHGIGAVLWDYFLLLPGICILVAGFDLLPGRPARELQVRMPARWRTLLVVALLAAALIVPGTDNGWLNMMHGLWLLFPAVWLLLPAAIERLMASWGRLRLDLRVVRTYAICIPAALALMSFSIRLVNPFRDSRRRWTLTAPLTDPRLRGILTSRERADVVNPLFVELRRRVKPGDSVLAYGHLPMVHFVTLSPPALSMAWPTRLQTSELKGRLGQMVSQGPLPVVVVRGRADMRDHNWGKKDRSSESSPEALFERKMELIDSTVRDAGYRLVWSNRCFEVLVRP